MIKITLDVATINTGFSVINEKNQLLKSGVIQTKNDASFFTGKVEASVKLIWKQLNLHLKEFKEEENILLILETSIIYQKAGSFVSAKTSEKLSIFVGLYISQIRLFFAKSNLRIKMVGPSSWQHVYKIEDKEDSKNKASQLVDRFITSDDEADAILLGLIGDKDFIKDFWEIAHIKRGIKHQKQSLTSKIKSTEALLNKYKSAVQVRVKNNLKPLKGDLDKVEKYKEQLSFLKNSKMDLIDNENKKVSWEDINNG